MLVCPWSSKVRVCLCTVHPWLLRHVIFSSHKSTVHFQNLHSKIQPNGQLFSGWLHLFRLGLHTFICGYLQWMQFWQIKTPINTKLITILHHELYALKKLFFKRIYFFSLLSTNRLRTQCATPQFFLVSSARYVCNQYIFGCYNEITNSQ